MRKKRNWISPEMEEFWKNKENEKRNEKVVDLNLITGGKDGTGGSDWMSPLPIGTVFYAETIHNVQNFAVLQLEIVNKTEKTILLYDNLTEHPFGRVNPKRFCNAFRLLEVFEKEEGALSE